MQGYRKLTTICCAAVLALGLAACGGGGDDTAEAPMVTDPPGPTLEEQLAAEKAAREAAEKALADKEKAEQDAANEAKAAEMAANGKALKGALGATPLANLEPLAADGQLAVLTGSGLVVHMDNGNDTENDGTASPRMRPGASAGTLAGWAGTNYAHKNAGTGVSNEAIVYNNRAAPRSRPAATAFAGANYVAATRVLSNIAGTASRDIVGEGFADAGTTTHTPATAGTNIQIPGTYMGAAGTYICDTAAACTSAAGTDGITLTGTWTFVHNVGAMTSEPDANYLYFGWWLMKNKDGDPTSASAFTGVVGAITAATSIGTDAPQDISGTATYTGGAAGKFAISDPLSGGDAGHFTADATLNATFGAGATAGLSGMLDNFMANEEAVPWSVTLLRRTWDGTRAGLTAQPADNDDTAGIDESAVGTVWSIDGSSAAASGGWTAQMYDERPSTPPAGDGSNVPTSVTGTFQSHFGSTHSMVGAFGATKE